MIVCGTSRRNVLGAIAYRKERLQLPVATTTETPPKATNNNEGTIHLDRKNRRKRKNAIGAQKPGKKPFPLDRLFQEGAMLLALQKHASDLNANAIACFCKAKSMAPQRA
jgi:hypothetical protein